MNIEWNEIDSGLHNLKILDGDKVLCRAGLREYAYGKQIRPRDPHYKDSDTFEFQICDVDKMLRPISHLRRIWDNMYSLECVKKQCEEIIINEMSELAKESLLYFKELQQKIDNFQALK